MTVKIVKDYIPKGKRNRPGYAMKPLYITIHSTGNTAKGADAKAHANYVKGSAAANIPASWHFTVDDKEIYQHLPVTENGWHATDGTNGPGNRQSIGIEICENKDGNQAKAIKNAAWLVAKLIKEQKSLKAFPGCMKQHADWYSINCPRILRTCNKWQNFLKQVEANLKPATTPKPTPKKDKHTVQREIAIYVGGKKQKEVGLLIGNQTRVTAGFAADLAGGSVKGKGDRVEFSIPKTNASKLAAYKAVIAKIEPLVDKMRKELTTL